MRRGLLGALAAVVLAAAEVPPKLTSPPDPAAAAELLKQVKRSTSPEEVRQLLGPPPRVCRQVLYNRVLEQWVYERPIRVRVEFDRPRGQPADLRAVYPADGGKS